MPDRYVGLRCIVRLREGYFLDKQVALLIYSRSNRALSVATELVMEDVKEGELPPTPPIILDSTAAQELMDSLWTCGIRPSEGQGSAGQLASVQYHLEDMRKIVFEKHD